MSKHSKLPGRSKVRAANRREDPLVEIMSNDVVKDSEPYFFECKRFRVLPRSVQDWAFDLLSSNMKTFYENSDWGWNPDEKMAELTARSAWCLLAKRKFENGQDLTEHHPAGFVHFRYDMDFGYPVVYCYEIHIKKEERGRGLGRRMLEILHRLARQAGMVKVVATVFKKNQDSLRFFDSCGFEQDETNPAEEDHRDYIILSSTVL